MGIKYFVSLTILFSRNEVLKKYGPSLPKEREEQVIATCFESEN